MNSNCYVVLDSLAEQVIGNPMLFKADAAAVRLFSDAFRDANSVIAKHPNDHALLCVGTLDESTGAMQTFTPRIVITGTQLVLASMEAANS